MTKVETVKIKQYLKDFKTNMILGCNACCDDRAITVIALLMCLSFLLGVVVF